MESGLEKATRLNSNINVSGDDPRICNHPTRPPDSVCAHCGARMPRRAHIYGPLVIWNPMPTLCDCESAKTERKRSDDEREKEAREKEAAAEAWREEQTAKRSGLTARQRTYTLESLEMTDGNRAAVVTAMRYANRVTEIVSGGKRVSGLYIYGGVGTGKTHISAGIAVESLRKGISVRIGTVQDILDKIRSGYDGGDLQNRIVDIYKSVGLLILDDIGKEPPTPWATATLYSIVNHRYEEMFPTVYTSNYSLSDLANRLASKSEVQTARAIADRIADTCVPLEIKGESWRKR